MRCCSVEGFEDVAVFIEMLLAKKDGSNPVVEDDDVVVSLHRLLVEAEETGGFGGSSDRDLRASISKSLRSF